MVERIRRVPGWLWLALIVLASAAARVLLSRQMPAPFIFTDELTYAELARSFAEDGSFAIRDVPTGGYGYVYPVLISPTYALFDNLTQAYAALKAINAVVMSLAAVPAYLIARRAVSRLGALLAAALTVAVPAMAYTSTVMTENVFYPVVLTCAWALVLVLVALLGLAVATRVQAVALVAAAAAAPLVLTVLDGRWRRVSRYLPLYTVLAGVVAVVIGAQLARGSSLESLLGAYAVVGDTAYDVGLALRYWLWHLEELTLAAGVVPVAALLALLPRARGLPAPAQRHLAVTLSSVACLSLLVAVFASRHASRIQERNLFYVLPLLFVALVVWAEHRRPGDRRVLVPAAAVAVALPVLFPFDRFIDTSAISDTLALLPLWSAFGQLPFDRVWATVLIGALVAAALVVLVPRRYALVVPVVLIVFLAVVSASVWSGERSFRQAGIGALFQGIRSVPRDWIDSGIPPGATVGALWTGRTDRFTININEFFNRTVGPVYYIGGPTPGGLPEQEVRITPGHVVEKVPGREPLTDRYLLADGSVEVNGTVVARDLGTGMTLWRVAGPRVTTADVSVSGLYPGDTWSGASVRYVRRGCRGGELVVALSSDAQLFRGVTTTVLARATGAAPVRRRLEPDGAATLRVPLRPRGGACVVRFSVSPTRNPSRVLAGSTDDRELGAHFNSFTYTP